MKLKFFQQIFQKYSNSKFHKNPSNGRRVVPCGRADRRPETCFSQLCERASISSNSFIKTQLISLRQTNTHIIRKSWIPK